MGLKSIAKQQRRKITRLYPFAYPSLNNCQLQGRAESGLYVVGRDPGSIFWYWEIHYDLETYREFQTLDLAEGEGLFREEWPAENDQT